MKKILVILIFLLSFTLVEAWTKSDFESAQKANAKAEKAYNDNSAIINAWAWDNEESSSAYDTAVINESWLKSEFDKSKDNLETKRGEYINSDEAKWDLTSPNFEIKVNDISPGIQVGGWADTSVKKVNFLLWTLVQKMMIALWSLSVLIMTVWGWYMILHNWQDELLSKWKSIFMSWIYAMIVALSSYYLIAIVRFLLYS